MLTRTNTKQLKDVAILLMLAHHLFTFPDRISYGLSPATPNLHAASVYLGRYVYLSLCFLVDMVYMLLLPLTPTAASFPKNL